jgi:5-methylcytosine-specific restriction endonuclease McrA
VKKHELIHAKEKPKIETTNQQNDDDIMSHSCEYCGNKFTYNPALIVHVRIQHIF